MKKAFCRGKEINHPYSCKRRFVHFLAKAQFATFKLVTINSSLLRSFVPHSLFLEIAWSFVALSGASKGVLAVVGSIPFSQLSPQCLLSLLVDGSEWA